MAVKVKNVTTVIKINALFEDITSNIESLAKGFTLNDYVIVKGRLINAINVGISKVN